MTRYFLNTIVLISMFALFCGCGKPTGWSERELATRELALYLADQTPAKKFLVVANPFSQAPGRNPQVYAFEQASIIGIKNGARDRLVSVGYPELQPDAAKNPGAARVDPKTTTPVIFLLAPNAFDRLAREHPDHEILVSLIGIPPKLVHPEIWRDGQGPNLAFLFPDWRLLGTRDEIQSAFKSGKVAAAVMHKPGATEDHHVRGDSSAEFERRFLLVTAANIDECLRKYPRLF